MSTPAPVKDTAEAIKGFCKEKNISIKHCHALELAARLGGVRNLHEAQKATPAAQAAESETARLVRLDSEAKTLRQSLGYRQKHENIAHYELADSYVLAEADGYGGAVVFETDNLSPENGMTKRIATFSSEQAASEFAEEYSDSDLSQEDWDKLLEDYSEQTVQEQGSGPIAHPQPGICDCIAGSHGSTQASPSDPNKPCTVYVAWGEAGARAVDWGGDFAEMDGEVEEYQFSTIEAAEAFKLGVSDSQEWMDYSIIETEEDILRAKVAGKLDWTGQEPELKPSVWIQAIESGPKDSPIHFDCVRWLLKLDYTQRTALIAGAKTPALLKSLGAHLDTHLSDFSVDSDQLRSWLVIHAPSALK